MNANYDLQPGSTYGRYASHDEASDNREDAAYAQRRRGRRIALPLILFLATCISTYMVGGILFAIPLMITLTAHELGHFFTARFYHVPASFPYFIPMPFNPIGTMGAVIAMHPGMGNRRSLFDIAVAGPLAGLVPALIFSVVGLQMSQVTVLSQENVSGIQLGLPLLFEWLGQWTLGPVEPQQHVVLHPMAYAGWVGIFITALNLIPIGQLDGGHTLYALLRGASRPLSVLLLLGALAAVVIFQYWEWTLMIMLLMLIGAAHPPTANDYIPLGRFRFLLGIVILLFPIIGFTPTPFVF
jgi:membrane-associated protease RseP (regulator of RpoE activity)